VEKAQVDELRSKAKLELRDKAAKARAEYIARRAETLAKSSGMTLRAARETISKQCDGVLLPSIALPFDDPELAGKTVADVLADPVAFEGETSPIRCKVSTTADAKP
jgi:hypothetical protein